jgi:hypothetical protein
MDGGDGGTEYMDLADFCVEGDPFGFFNVMIEESKVDLYDGSCQFSFIFGGGNSFAIDVESWERNNMVGLFDGVEGFTGLRGDRPVGNSVLFIVVLINGVYMTSVYSLMRFSCSYRNRCHFQCLFSMALVSQDIRELSGD